MGVEAWRSRADREQCICPEEWLAQLGLHHRRNFYRQEGGGGHQFHGIPVQIFRRNPLVRQGRDWLDAAADRLASAERSRREDDRSNVCELALRNCNRYREG